MKPLFPSPVAEWRNASYAAIDPTRPELSMAGKTVAITGGGTGIGGRLSKHLLLLALHRFIYLTERRQRLRRRTKIVESDVPGVNIVTHIADVMD